MESVKRNQLRAGGLLRSIARRSRSDWPLVLAAWLLLACATSLIASAIAYSESVTLGGFRKGIEAASPAATAVRVYTSVAASDLPAADAAIRPAIESTLGAGLGSTDLIETTDGLSLAGYDASDQAHRILVGSYDGIERHARLTGGVWPADQPKADGERADPCAADLTSAAPIGNEAERGAKTAATTEAGDPSTEAALSDPAAAALGLKLGDHVTLTSKLDPNSKYDVCIAGTFAPDETDRYWLASPLELTGVQTNGSSVTRGPFVVTPAGLAELTGSNNLTAEWRWLPDISTLAPGDADSLRTAIGSLKDRVQAAYSGGFVWQDGGLPDVLAAAVKDLLVARSSSLLLFAQFVVLAVYAILLVGGMLVERRRPESTLLRSRGASWPHLALLSLGEALLLAVPAVVVAPFVAQAVVRLMGIVGPLAGENVVEPVGTDAATVAAAIAAGVGCVAVLTIPSLPGVGSLSGVRAALGRQLDRTLAQRLGLDAILVAVAAVALWQLRSYGSPITTTVPGDLGIDPLLVAAPAIGLLAGALAAIRLVPRLGEIGERMLEGAAGLATTFLARQIGRRPLRSTRITLLLMLAVAMGTFAAAFAATWNDSQAEQAAYQSGGDVRVTLAPQSGVPQWALKSLYESVPGVVAVAAVGRDTFDVGRDVRSGQLLAVEPGALATSSTQISGADALSQKVAALGDGGGGGGSAAAGSAGDASISLPADSAQLQVNLQTNLVVAVVDPAVDVSQLQVTVGVAVSVVVADSAGTYRLDGGTIESPATAVAAGAESPGASPPGSPTTESATMSLSVDVSSSTYRFSGPVRLVGVELGLSSSVLSSIEGTVELTGVSVRGSSGGSWQPLSGLPTANGWGWAETQGSESAEYTAPAGRPGLVELGSEASQARPGSGGSGVPATVLRYSAGAGQSAVPGIASAELLQATGARLGDTILISRAGYETSVGIAGTAEIFPTLDPAEPFLVVDAAALARAEYASYGLTTAPKELWLKVSPGRETAVTAALAGGPYSAASVQSRLDIERTGRADPISLGVIGALFLGSLAALLLAAIGFLVNAAFMAAERNGELAVLRALGERSGTIVRMLAFEQFLLLLYGLVGGVVLGVVLGWLAIPFAWLTPAGTVPVPTPGIVVPWSELAVVAVPLVAALLLGATLLIRSALGPPAATLRLQDVAP